MIFAQRSKMSDLRMIGDKYILTFIFLEKKKPPLLSFFLPIWALFLPI